jgi:alpha-tubulin suppressor-like RCC1 family protein
MLEFYVRPAEQGELWSFGDNSLGQLGRLVVMSTLQSRISTFTDENSVERVQGPLTRERVLHLGAGLGHSLAVNAQGSVYSWGWNAGHQLGRDGRRESPLPACVEDLEGEDVVALAGGRAHSLALTSKGGLWVWGSGKNGRLGLGSPADEPSPFPLECLEAHRIAAATCGFDHTLILLP